MNAIYGWLELGCPAEARAELAKISSRSLAHPEVIEAHWQLMASEKNWEEALELARALIAAEPDAATGWISQSFCLHELKRTQEAWELLLPLAAKFSEIGTIPYNLACYSCQLGKLDMARKWLKRAVEIRSRAEIKELAKDDPDLTPLWGEIREW